MGYELKVEDVYVGFMAYELQDRTLYARFMTDK